MNENIINQLREEIRRRENGRLALINALLEVAQSKNHKQAVARATQQLQWAGVSIPNRIVEKKEKVVEPANDNEKL